MVTNDNEVVSKLSKNKIHIRKRENPIHQQVLDDVVNNIKRDNPSDEYLKFRYPRDYYLKPENFETLVNNLNTYIPFFKEATNLVVQHLFKRSNILVLTDYDCDGAMSASCIHTLLKYAEIEGQFYSNYKVFINKRRFGNGINKGLIEHLQTNENIDFNTVDLIITADHGCGSIDYLLELLDTYPKLNIVVTDHHEVPKLIPESYKDRIYIVNAHYPVEEPKQLEILSTFRKLSGCTIASMFLANVITDYTLKIQDDEDLKFGVIFLNNLTRVVGRIALTIISDVMDTSEPLNRFLFQHGMSAINIRNSDEFEHILFDALGVVTLPGFTNGIFTISDLKFILSPMFNACNRFHTEYLLEEVLLKDRIGTDLVDNIKNIISVNKQRKAYSNDVIALIMQKMENLTKEVKGISLYVKTNAGINGIIAGKLAELHKRPVTCFINSFEDDDVIHGSLRTYGSINLLEILSQLKEENIVEHFGGHKAACGCSILKSNYDRYKTRFNELSPSSKEDKVFEIDYILEPSKITSDLEDRIKTLEPFGLNFEEPKFYTEVTFNRSFTRERIGSGTVFINPDDIDNSPRLNIVGFSNSTYDINEIFREFNHVGLVFLYKGELRRNNILSLKCDYAIRLNPNDEIIPVI